MKKKRVLVTKDPTDEINELIRLGNDLKREDGVENPEEKININNFDFKLYFVIRSHIDWETGIVGNNFGLRRSTLISTMQEKRIYGSNKEIPEVTEGVLKASIKRLEKAGFLITRSINTKDTKRLIFELPKAIRDNSVKKPNDRGTTDSERPSGSIDIKGDHGTGTTGEQPTSNARYHIDRNNKEDIVNLYTLDEENEKNKLPKHIRQFVDFIHCEKHNVLAKELGVDLTQDIVEAFKDHFIARPSEAKKITRTDLAFNNWLRNRKNWRQNAKSSGNNQSGQRKESYITTYTDKLAKASEQTLARISGEAAKSSESNIFEDDVVIRPSLASDSER